MPLPQGKLLASAETQAGVSSKFEQAMQDLYLKGEMQRAEKAKKEQEEAKKEYKEQLDAPRNERLAYQKEYGEREKNVHDEEQDVILDNDTELDKLRLARMEQLKRHRKEYTENLAKGHKEYSEIVEDEFIKTVTGSKFCVCHFYHNDFERCKIMDKHLRILADKHVETKFIKINSEKTPFFVNKLGIKVLPSLIFFDDGKAIDRMLGFEGLPGGDELKTRDLEERIGETGVIKMEREFYEEMNANPSDLKNQMKKITQNIDTLDDDDDIWDD